MILANKALQNTERKKVISHRAEQLVKESEFIVSGDSVEITGEDPKSRIVKGFNALIEKVNPNLRMLGGVQYHEQDILGYLTIQQDSLLSSDAVSLNEAAFDMLTTIKNNKTRGEKTTMKKIVDKYEARPYGWYLAAIQCIAAQLAGQRKIEFWLDGNLLENSPLEKALRNTYGFSNLELMPVVAPPPDILRALKRFIKDFFNEPVSYNEARPLVKSIREKMVTLKNTLEDFYYYRTRYPFLSRLQPIVTRINDFLNQDHTYFVTLEKFPEDIDDWLDLKETEIDPLVNFMKGQKKEIYDQLVDFVNQSKPDFTNGELADLETYLEDPQIYLGNKLQQAKMEMDKIGRDLQKRLEEARQNALKKIDELQQGMHQMSDFEKLDTEDQKKFDQSFEEVRYAIQTQSLSVSIRDKVEKYDVNEYPALLTKIKQLVNQQQKQDEDDDSKPIVSVIHVSNLHIPAPKKILEDEDDVEEYCEILE